MYKDFLRICYSNSSLEEESNPMAASEEEEKGLREHLLNCFLKVKWSDML